MEESELERGALMRHYTKVRGRSQALCTSLEPEDHQLQAMPDVSPPKWHLAHTTWFFETFVLSAYRPDREPFDPAFGFLFNSYYESEGARQPRPLRGLLSRPTIERVWAWREAIDDQMEAFASEVPDRVWEQAAPRILLGLHHEQQHQELLATDIKYNLGTQPTRPVWQARTLPQPDRPTVLQRWHAIEGGVVEIGHGGDGFAFDNETPRHQVLLRPFQLAHRLVTEGEYRSFIEDGGYDTHSLWLSDGWAWLKEHGVDAPLYWRRHEGGWRVYTLHGERALEPSVPVTHISAYEAAAFAAWAGARLPTEAEWEHAAAALGGVEERPEFAPLHPRPVPDGDHALQQLTGECWQWTRSSYLPYPGYRPLPGALGEYNGKFMSGQWVLRGGSCATPPGHARLSYRNFFYPHQRWQFTGIRLARDL